MIGNDYTDRLKDIIIGRRGTTTDIQGASLERGGIRDLRILAY